jgi:hypothetical protein
MKDNRWARLLAYVTGVINQELLLQNEYLIAENRILRSQLPKRLHMSDPPRSTLAEIGKRLGRRPPAGCLRSETGDDSGVVSQAGSPRVRVALTLYWDSPARPSVYFSSQARMYSSFAMR